MILTRSPGSVAQWHSGTTQAVVSPAGSDPVIQLAPSFPDGWDKGELGELRLLCQVGGACVTLAWL